MQSHLSYLKKLRVGQDALAEQKRINSGDGLGTRSNDERVALRLGGLTDSPDTILPTRQAIVYPVRVYPFRSLTTNETLGADRPEFTFPGNLAQNGNVIGFSSFSRRRDDYNVAWNVGGSFVIVGKNPSTVTPQLFNYAFRGNDFFSTNIQTFNASSSSANPNTNNSQSVITGTPIEVLEPSLTVRFWQLGSQQNGPFPESYENTENINRTRTYTPGVVSSLTGQSTNFHTQQTIDAYTAGTGSSGAGAPESCIEEEASQGVLWTGSNGTAPGRNRETSVNWGITASGTAPYGYISAGTENIQNSASSFTQTVSQNASVSIQPRQWSLTVTCRGTGIISFVPRIFFNTTLIDPAVVAAQASYSSVRESTHSGIIQVLPSYSIPINNFYRQTDLSTIPSYNPITDGLQRTNTIDIEQSERRITPLFYDEEAHSCIFSDRLFTSETQYFRFDQFPVQPYGLSVNTSTYAPQALPFAASASAPSLNLISEGSGGGTGSRVTNTDTVEGLKGVRAGQPVDFGERAGTVRSITENSFSESFFLNAQVGDTFTEDTILTVQRPVTFSLNLPSSNQLADEVVTFRTILTPEEQILTRRFIVQRRFFPSTAWNTLICTAIAIGPNQSGAYSSINTTQRHSTTFRIDGIYLNNYHTPVTLDSPTDFFRFDHVSDLFPTGIPISRSRWTILPSADPDVFWDIWASQPPPTDSSGARTAPRKHTYSRGRLMMNGSIQWDFTPVEGDYVAHSGGAGFVKVHP